MKLWTEALGPIQTNGYVLTKNEKAIIIDPGMNPEPLIEYVAAFDTVAILLTHAHFDHIGGLEAVRQKTGAPVYIHEAEEAWLTDPTLNGSARWPMVTEPIRCQPSDTTVAEGQTLHLADLELQVLHTPGHSPGSVSYYVPEGNLVIAGDTLFASSIGRTDLPGGDYQTLINSIQQKLFTLPDEVRVYPGHGPATTIREEKETNPFVGAFA